MSKLSNGPFPILFITLKSALQSLDISTNITSQTLSYEQIHKHTYLQGHSRLTRYTYYKVLA